MTTNDGEPTSPTDSVSTEVTKLTEQVADLTKSNEDLRVANTQFANQMGELSGQGDVLKTIQSELEQSKNTNATLLSELDQAKASIKTSEDTMIARRRTDLITKYNLPEERVSGLGDEALKALEETLPHMKSAVPDPITNKGLDINPTPPVSTNSEKNSLDRANDLITKMKSR